MDELLDLAYMHYLRGFRHSALLISEYLHFTKMSTPTSYYIMLSSLIALNYHRKVEEIFMDNPNLLDYTEIRFLAYSIGMVKESSHNYTIPIPSTEQFKTTSLQRFYIGLNKEELVRKKFFLESFVLDPRNLEPLILLLNEGLSTEHEVIDLLEKHHGKDKKIANMFQEVFTFSSEINSSSLPVVHKIIMSYYHNDHLDELYKISVFYFDPKHENSINYESSGLYYIKNRQYRKGRSVFRKLVKLNPQVGRYYLYLGISNSFLNETEKSIKNIMKSSEIMADSHVPLYFLAYVYQKLNNYKRASYYYKKCVCCMSKNRNTFLKHKIEKLISIQKTQEKDVVSVVSSFVFLLIYHEEYTKALEYLEQYGIQNLLNVYCLLFMGKQEEALSALEKCEKIPMYYGTKGYICHLRNRFYEATKYYEISISQDKENGIVGDLMMMAIESVTKHTDNHIFEYSNSLFEQLPYKKCNLDILD